ncbi:MAG TPA: hypothetical protein VM553_18675 [Dongiaceae bacterium]|nr:hypothetical protein [Dongiaceae bacterium]
MSYTLIHLGHADIAVPHAALAGIETLSDAVPDRSDNSAWWQLQRDGRSWSLLALDQDLQPHRTPDGQQRLAVCFQNSATAISCQSVEVLADDEVEVSLPAALRRSNTCLRGFIVHHQDNVALVVDANQLQRRLEEFLQTWQTSNAGEDA